VIRAANMKTGVKLINRLRRKVRVNMRLVMGAMSGPGHEPTWWVLAFSNGGF